MFSQFVSAMISFVRRKWWLVLILVLIAIGGAWYWRSSAQAKNKPVATTQAEVRDIEKKLSFSGKVDAHQRVRMFFAGTGKLTFIGAQEGQAVKKYQTLATLDQRSFVKTLQKQLSLYEAERLDFENASDTREDRTLAEREQRVAQQDQLSLNRTVLDVELQSLAIENTRLSTPIAGILVSSPVKTAGMNIAPTDVFEVVDPATLYFRLQVDEVDVDEVQVGQEVTVRLDSKPDTPLRAVVEKIAFQATETLTGTVFTVDVKFLDAVNIADQRVGMNGDADILLASAKNVMVLPISAVTFRDEKRLVSVQKADGTLEEREVQPGIETDTEMEVVSGLSPEEKVVLP